MMSFEQWFSEVQRIGKLLEREDYCCAPAADWWLDYFHQDLTPAEAWAEETVLFEPAAEQVIEASYQHMSV